MKIRFYLLLITLLGGIMKTTFAQQPTPYDYVVSPSGNGNFTTVQEAINAIPDFRKKQTRILVTKGIYEEKLIVPPSKTNVVLIGENGTILSYDDYSNKLNVFGETKGTSGSASVYLYAPDFYAENITFQNTSGPVGQAVACLVVGDRIHFKNCRFIGFQDTLYTWGTESRQYYEECYIEGTVDFIFGASTAVFDRCHIHSKSNGFITAPSTPDQNKYGYVFFDCELTADEGVNDVYLSRPWRPYAQAVFIRCKLGRHINPKGWNNWDKKANEKTVFYAEYENSGEGADTSQRVSYSHQLENIADYAIQKILNGWNPI